MRVGPSRRLCQRIYAFELWCWGRLLRVPWTARRSNQSILKEINPEYSLEGLILKLKHQYFGHLMHIIANSLEKTMMLAKIKGRKRREWQRIRLLDSVTNSMDMSLNTLCEIDSEGQGSLVCWVHGVVKSRIWLSDWTTTIFFFLGTRITTKQHNNWK